MKNLHRLTPHPTFSVVLLAFGTAAAMSGSSPEVSDVRGSIGRTDGFFEIVLVPEL
jgi:hypothetical protein